MVKFNYIQNIKYWQEVFWILNMCFYILLHLFFFFRWEVAPSTVNAYYSPPQNRISKILRKKIHCSFISHGIFYVKCTWREQNIIREINVKWTWHENRICVFAFSEWFFFLKFIKKSSSTNCVSVLNQAWCCFDSVSSGYSTASLLPQGLSKVSTLN